MRAAKSWLSLAWDGTINPVAVLAIATALYFAVTAVGDAFQRLAALERAGVPAQLQVELAAHNQRLGTVETAIADGRDEDRAFQDEVRETLGLIREDVAGLKAERAR